jgi:hypothetical protein
MTPLEALDELRSAKLIDTDGNPVELKLKPPMTAAELAEFEDSLPCHLPVDVRELLLTTRGIEGPSQDIDFNGTPDFGLDEVFPHPIVIAGDGFGNFWVIDATAAGWGPVYFACHDAPVILYQSADLSEFLTELLKCYQPPHESLLQEVQEDRMSKVWATNPGTMTVAEAAAGSDAELKAFASSLEPEWLIVDLRQAKPGAGFAWGRFGPRTEIKRAGTEPIFAYRKPKPAGLLGKLFGRS